MTTGASKNIIMSHGGRHGAGGTYLKGVPIPEATQPFVPKELLGQVHAPLEKRPEPPQLTVQLAPPQPVAAPAAPAPVAAAVVPPPAPSLEAPPATPTTALPAQTSNTAAPAFPGAPKNRRELFLLTKEQMMVLSAQVGIPCTPEETVKVIRDRIQEKLAL